MKKIKFILAALFISTAIYAQVGIQTNTPDANSDLTLGSTNKGLRMNKVALTGTKDGTTVGAHTAGMVVYNTATAGTGATAVEPAFYYNDGTKWNKLKPSQTVDAVYDINAVPPPTGTTGITLYTAEDGSTSSTLPANADTAMFIDPNGAAYTWDGTKFVTFTQVASTEWYLKSTTNDASSNKTDLVYRPGFVGVGDFANKNNALTVTNKTSSASSIGTSPTGLRVILNDDAGDTAASTGNLRGAVITTTNNSAVATAALMVGIQSDLDNNTATRFNNVRNLSLDYNLNAGAGVPNTAGVGIYNRVANVATSTNTFGAYYNYQGVLSQNSASTPANMFGITMTTSTGTGATVGVPNSIRGIDNTTTLASGKAVNSTNFYGIYNDATNSSASSPATNIGIFSSIAVTGTGYARSALKGLQVSATNSSTNAGTTTAFYGVHFNTDQTSATNLATNLMGLRNELSIAGTGISKDFNGFYNLATVTSTATYTAGTAASYGIYNLLQMPDTSKVSFPELVGLYSYNNFRSAGLAKELYGSRVYNYNLSTNTGTADIQTGSFIYNLVQGNNAVTNAYGLYVQQNVSDTNVGAVANSYGAYIDTNKGGTSTLTNQYGLYLTNVANATNNWAIYSAGGNSYHAGKIGIGGTSVINPTAQLHLDPIQTVEGIRIDKPTGIAGQPQLVLNENRPSQTVAHRAIELINGSTPLVEIGAKHDASGVMDYFYISTNETDLGTNAYNSSDIVYLVNPATNNTSIGGNIQNPDCKLEVNGYIKVGSTDATGSATPTAGMIRYNAGKFQGYVGAPTNAWQDLN